MMAALRGTLTIRLEDDVKAALERKAKAEDRTPSAIVRLLIRDGLQRDGLLAEAASRA
jgi:predicted transcriptional regulator